MISVHEATFEVRGDTSRAWQVVDDFTEALIALDLCGPMHVTEFADHPGIGGVFGVATSRADIARVVQTLFLDYVARRGSLTATMEVVATEGYSGSLYN